MLPGFILLEKFCELTGYSEEAVRKKIERGDFVRGVHFETQGDRNIKIDWEAYNLWAQGVPAHVIQAWKRAKIQSVYDSIGEGEGQRRSNLRQAVPT